MKKSPTRTTLNRSIQVKPELASPDRFRPPPLPPGILTSWPPDMQQKEWRSYLRQIACLLEELVRSSPETYRGSREVVCGLLEKRSAAIMPFPVVSDFQAAAMLSAVETLGRWWVEHDRLNRELILRSSRHLREHLNDLLIEKHLGYLGSVLKQGERELSQLIHRLNGTAPHAMGMDWEKLLDRLRIYHSVGSFLHPPELTLSGKKIQARAHARARKGNFWPHERREKTIYLEELADAGKVHPPFTEEDLLFLISQCSQETLRRKIELLESEGLPVTPNHLKANLSRLRAHILRRKQHQQELERRKMLLHQLGATPDQIEYISARASYQTMSNLLGLADGSLAISDLMGGRRAIQKILRHQGRIPSEAETALARYLIDVEGMDPHIAHTYARSRKNHSLEHLKQTLRFLKDQYKRYYRNHWGFEIQPEVLRRALELGLSRPRLDKRAMSARDYLYDLRAAVSRQDHDFVRSCGPLTPQERREALRPLRETLDYETDATAKQQLLFIYEQFIEHGLCISREKLKRICLRKRDLFPRPRKLQDALEILNGSYRAIGQHGDKICVSPDYLLLPGQRRNCS